MRQWITFHSFYTLNSSGISESSPASARSSILFSCWGRLVLLAHLTLEPSFSLAAVFLNKHLILSSHLLKLLVKIWPSCTVHLHINRAALLLSQQMKILWKKKRREKSSYSSKNHIWYFLWNNLDNRYFRQNDCSEMVKWPLHGSSWGTAAPLSVQQAGSPGHQWTVWSHPQPLAVEPNLLPQLRAYSFQSRTCHSQEGKRGKDEATNCENWIYCYSTQNSTLNAINSIALQITYFKWKSSAASLVLSSFRRSSVFSTKRLWIFQGQMGMCGWSLLIFHWA